LPFADAGTSTGLVSDGSRATSSPRAPAAAPIPDVSSATESNVVGGSPSGPSFVFSPLEQTRCDANRRDPAFKPQSRIRYPRRVRHVELTARTATIRLAETFVISRESQDEAEVVQVEIRHDGISGYGEAAPIERYDESAQSALAWLEGVELGDDPWALDAIWTGLPPGEQAARAAVDAALYDLQGKLVGLPVWKLVGLRRDGPPTSWTVWLGDPDDMARRAEAAERRGFRRLKLKLGGRDGLDLERVQAVRAASRVPLQVDVNEYWSLDEALELLPRMEIEYCEQPLPAGDPDGPELKRRSPVPIYVDEDCHVAADVPACAERAHGVNVKLAKSGGIREALRIAVTARALGLGVMLGCMVESGLGIAAGAQIASTCDHVDLDGNLLLAHDPWPGVEFAADGVQRPADRPGLGVQAASAAAAGRRT
jgi:L-alanine-DL-glutamate epimerase-like enolase superfamily enzyme